LQTEFINYKNPRIFSKIIITNVAVFSDSECILTEYRHQSEKEDCLSLSPYSGAVPGRPKAKLTAQHRRTNLNVPTTT